jgi:hypothetical protein
MGVLNHHLNAFVNHISKICALCCFVWNCTKASSKAVLNHIEDPLIHRKYILRPPADT